MEERAVLFKLMSPRDKERSLAGTSAVMELPTLNTWVQGINFVLNGFRLNDNCSVIFSGSPLNAAAMFSIMILCSFSSRHLPLYCFPTGPEGPTKFTSNLFTTIFPTSNILPDTQQVYKKVTESISKCSTATQRTPKPNQS